LQEYRYGFLDVHQMNVLLHHPLGDLPGSLIPHGYVDDDLASVYDQLFLNVLDDDQD
jgi:hypothetical protein